MGKHLLDETAEFAMPRPARHAAPETGELEITQRFDSGRHRPRPAPAPQQDEDEEAR